MPMSPCLTPASTPPGGPAASARRRPVTWRGRQRSAHNPRRRPALRTKGAP
jgi:hypothetical protein